MKGESGEPRQILVQPGIHERLARVSALMNVPVEALVPHALEAWVATQERSLALIEAAAESVGGDMGLRLKGVLRTGLFARQQEIDPRTLTEAEASVIAEHEGLSHAAGAGLGAALLQSEWGRKELERLILASIERETAHGRTARVDELRALLSRFRAEHTG